jgi:uncharacterized Zn finger protein
MNINNFEQEIDAKILARGKEYFADGLVDELEERDDGHYEAAVEGTDDYTVTVLLKGNGDIDRLSCDCPYEFGDVCKHEVAVLLAIRDEIKKSAAKKPRKSKNEKADLKELLEAQTKETLAGLLYAMAEDDRALRQALLLRFSKQDHEFELSRKLIQEHIRLHKKRGYIEWNETDAALTGAWEVLDRAKEAVDADCIRAVKLCFVVVPEVFAMLDYCDDSNGNVGEVLAHCVEITRNAVLTGQNALPKHSRDELFDLIAEESKRDIYKGWSDFRLSFLECLMPMAGDPALYQKLWDRFEDERHGFIERGGYYEQAIARLQLQLLKQWDNEERCRKFLLEHLQ